MRFPRLTTRRWILAVAVIAVMIGYVRSSIQMWQIASYHGQQSRRVARSFAETGHRFYVQRQWHARMEQKYRAAIWFPWFPVEPEPHPP